MTRSEKAEELKKIAERVAKNTKCPLQKTATHAVPGEGSPNAKIFFIGEAPGKNEDLTGRPFVGAAGKMLTELLATIGLKREDVFITSIEKFRPPNNRPPTRKEIMACFPHLEAQITTIKPKVIVPLGRHALQRMLEWEAGEELAGPPSMDTAHGKAIKSKKYTHVYFPLYHPAALLYNRKLGEAMKKDLKKLATLL